MYWTVVVFFSTVHNSTGVTHVGAVAFATVMAFNRQGPLCHTDSGCRRACVCVCV